MRKGPGTSARTAVGRVDTKLSTVLANVEIFPHAWMPIFQEEEPSAQIAPRLEFMWTVHGT